MSLVLAMLMVLSFALTACGGDKDPENEQATFKTGTYRTTTAVMPSNWNEFTYQDANDTQILSYISSSFFEYDYEFDGDKFNKDGSVNKDAIVDGSFTTNYSAATKLEDVTATVDAKWGYTEEQKAQGGYAWKITLRNDLKWDDGSAIKADDFIYSMQEILNPDFMNYRANTYYDTLRIKKSRAYFYKNQEVTYPTIGSFGYTLNADAVAADEDIHIDMYAVGADLFGLDLSTHVDAEGNDMPQYLPYDDETLYDLPEVWAMEEGEAKDEASLALNAAFFWSYVGAGASYGSYCEPGAQYESWLGIKVVNDERDVVWADVGMVKVDEYSFILCLDKAYSFLKEDGSLSYQSAYYMSSLPLVKKSLYEKCKVEPVEGSTLWTSTYNSSLATTASWGPYKLSQFQSDKFYKLVRNENWYGYGLETNKNQYNVTAIECECVPETSTQWLKFLGGETDDAALDTEHVADYMYSKYTSYAPGSGTFGMQLYGNLPVLKASKNNNTILAIDEFRQAFSLALNRADVVETIWPGSAVACYGLLNSMYYHDVENGLVYRNTTEAKEGLLRAYGFTEENGTWSDGNEIKNATLEEAYEALTGYNPVLSKKLMQEAYDIMVGDPDTYGYDPSKKITLIYGSSQDTPKQRERATYLQGVLDAVTAGTSLEGQIEIVFDASAGSGWSDAFRSGATQIGFGYGFQGNAFNPFDIVGAFVNPDDDLNYHTYWNTKTVMKEITLPEGDYEGAGETITMSLANWYFCLNGLAEVNQQTYKYNWDAGYAPVEARLTILAALEEEVIKKAHSVMLIGDYSGSLLGAKFSQFSKDYNTFMGFGGIRYMIVNYTDAEWDQYVDANNGDLTEEYKKTE